MHQHDLTSTQNMASVFSESTVNTMSTEEGDIDDLLDSALEDFDNLPKPKSKSNMPRRYAIFG